MIAIETKELVKEYPGKVRSGRSTASRSTSRGPGLRPARTERAGKTTTVKILTTLSKPTAGTAHIGGVDVVREPRRVRRSIGVVAQKAGVDPTATGRENVELQGRFFGLGGAASARVDELLALVELTDAADGSPARTRAAWPDD